MPKDILFPQIPDCAEDAPVGQEDKQVQQAKASGVDLADEDRRSRSNGHQDQVRGSDRAMQWRALPREEDLPRTQQEGWDDGRQVNLDRKRRFSDWRKVHTIRVL